MRILVTGGAGYVGSHTALSLLLAGHEVSILDNLSSSPASAADAVRHLSGRPARLFIADIRDREAIRKVLAKGFDCIVHSAGWKSVRQSTADPLGYRLNNVEGSRILFEEALSHGATSIVFSSSATVYGAPQTPRPLRETDPVSPSNPYGEGKLEVELMLRDLCERNPLLSATALRFFNPVGCHPSGLLGESPSSPSENIMPAILRAADGSAPLSIFPSPSPTPDGSCVRDFLHVSDIADAHLASVTLPPGFRAANLGSGSGLGAETLVRIFEKSCGVEIPRSIAPSPRPGDAPFLVADPTLARELLGWEPRLSIEEACLHSLNRFRLPAAS